MDVFTHLKHSSWTHMEAVTHSKKYILGHILYIWSFDMYAYVQTQRKKRQGVGGNTGEMQRV